MEIINRLITARTRSRAGDASSGAMELGIANTARLAWPI